MGLAVPSGRQKGFAYNEACSQVLALGSATEMSSWPMCQFPLNLGRRQI